MALVLVVSSPALFTEIIDLAGEPPGQVNRAVRDSPDSGWLSASGVESLQIVPGKENSVRCRLMKRYEILELIGVGGMGQVYRARDSHLKREVALKFLRGQGDEDTQRLLREARSQALVSHPNFCQVYDAGEDEGRFFIAMQLVDGSSLDQATAGLSVDSKVRALALIADAMQHAHNQGLVHRDLKPANVLVEAGDGNGLHPYIMDFGLAIQHDSPGLTATGVVQGTPAYMAPETVIQGRDAGPAADIYALGAMLFELLSGRPPYLGESALETAMAVLDGDPPSVRTLAPNVPRDVGLIVAKCLEREPERRYRSARALAEDLERYLRGDPVLAEAPSLTYRFKRRVQRNKAVSALTVLFLLSALMAAGKYTFDLRRERTAAVAATNTAQEALKFFVDLFQSSDRATNNGADTTARELLERARNRIDSELSSEPLLQATLMSSMGAVYSNLGVYEEASTLLEAALVQAMANGVPEREELEMRHRLSITYLRRGLLQEAVDNAERALAVATEQFGDQAPEVAQALRTIGAATNQLGRHQESEQALLRALDVVRATSDGQSLEEAKVLGSLAGLHYNQGLIESAIEHQREVMQIHEVALGREHPTTLIQRYNLATFLSRQGEFEAAEAEFTETLVLREKLYGSDHPDLVTVLNGLGSLYYKWDQPERSIDYMQRSLSIAQAKLGPKHPNTLMLLGNVGTMLHGEGRLAEAEQMFREALTVGEEVQGASHLGTGYKAYGLANVLRDQKKYSEAEPHYQRALQIFEQLEAEQELRNTHRAYARLLEATGRLDQAEAFRSSAED